MGGLDLTAGCGRPLVLRCAFWWWMDWLRAEPERWPEQRKSERRAAVLIARSFGVRYRILAAALGITVERVRQVERKAHARIHRAQRRQRIAGWFPQAAHSLGGDSDRGAWPTR